MKPVVRIGDPTTTGGVVISGAMNSMENGKPIACKGDMVTCPVCPPHSGQISEGHEQWKIGGRPVALHGHIVACGCPRGSNKVIATQFEDGVK